MAVDENGNEVVVEEGTEETSNETVDAGSIDPNTENQDVDENILKGSEESQTTEEEKTNSEESGEIEHEGKKYIPVDGIQKRIDKVIAERNEAESSAQTKLLETIQSDPVARKKFVDALGVEEKSTKDDVNEPSPTQAFLANITDKSHQAFYTNMIGALGKELESHIAAKLEAALSPIMSHIGETKLTTFSSSVKDFGKYKNEIGQIMQETPGLTVERAYKIAAFEDKIKSSRSGGAVGEANRKKKLGQTPISKNPGGIKKDGTSKTLDEAFDKAWDNTH